MKKYEFTGETKVHNDKVLYRIRALIDFGDVKAGELGGWIEKKSNLSQYGDCWVGDDVVVEGHAFIGDNAFVGDDANVKWHAIVRGRANVRDNATVGGYVVVKGQAVVKDNAYVGGNVILTGSIVIAKDGYIRGNSDYLTIRKIENEHEYITFYKTRRNTINVADKDFTMILDEFMKKVEKAHKDKKIVEYYKQSAEKIKMRCE